MCWQLIKDIGALADTAGIAIFCFSEWFYRIKIINLEHIVFDLSEDKDKRDKAQNKLDKIELKKSFLLLSSLIIFCLGIFSQALALYML